MGPKDRKPEEGPKTEMLNVNKPIPEPRRSAPTAPEEGPKTEMLNIGKPAEPPPKRKAPVLPDTQNDLIMKTMPMLPEPPDSPIASPDDAPGATQMLKVDAPAPAPRKKVAPRLDDPPPPVAPPRRAPAPAAVPVRKAAPPVAHAEGASDGATQMLDLRHVPTPEEMRQQALKKAAQPSVPARRSKMPEEIEVPIEHLQEAIHEKAHESGHGHSAGGGFNMQVALSSALLAVLAAVSALMAGHFANESMVEQIRSSDQWAFYQAKSIKEAIVTAKIETLQGLGKPVTEHAEDKQRYADERKEIQHKAKELEAESHHHLNQHQVLARTVTLLQISIALSAIAVLTRKKLLWYFSLLGGAAGAIILVQALFFTH